MLSEMRNNALFVGCAEGTLELLFNGRRSSDDVYERGEVIIKQKDSNDCLLIIISGQAAVTKNNAVIKYLSEGDVFGVSTLFSGDERFNTTVTAIKTTELYRISKPVIETALRSDMAFMRNYLCFLSGKIQYLNSVIDRYTGSNSAKRLASYLQALSKNYGDSFCVNMSAAAASVNLGRASVYRAADELQSLGLIQKQGKTITILNAEHLDKFITE